MGVHSSIEELGKLANEPVVLAIGMFDGVHLGHQSVINLAIKEAITLQGRVVALTFAEHPASFLRPGKEPALIMNPQTKASELIEAGARDIILRSFDREIAELEAKEFANFLKNRIPSLSSICVGKNFRFGKDRVGDYKVLKDSSKKIGTGVLVAESKLFLNQPISSSRIRKCLSRGEIELVNEMLGRNYLVKGVVSPGKAMGRTIGFPTLNIPWNPEAQPAYGVYVGIVENLSSDEKLPAVANYGLRPTIESDAMNPLLEIHILEDMDSGIWCKESNLQMELRKFLRPEKKFPTFEELKNQIAKDRKRAKEIAPSL